MNRGRLDGGTIGLTHGIAHGYHLIGYHQGEVNVSRVQEIEQQLLTLSSAELRELRAWFDEHEDRIWDETFAADINAGKWDALAEKALQDHRESKSTEF